MFDRSDIKNIYQLSPMQEGMLFHAMLDKESKAYFQQMQMEVQGEVDVTLLEESLNAVIERYDVLRTVFMYEKVKSPIQLVLNRRKAGIYYEDISGMEAEAKEHFMADFIESDKKNGFELTKDALIRLSVIKMHKESYRIIWSYHHIIMDGWGLGIFLNDFIKIYYSLRAKQPVELPVAYPYSRFIRWLQKQDKEKAYNYWKSYLEGYDEKAVLPQIKRHGTQEEYRQEEIIFSLGEHLTNAVIDLSKKRLITVSTLFQTVWGILLQRYNNREDVVFGAVVSGRPAEIAGIENMLGLFINTVPVRVKNVGEESFSELAGRVQKSANRSNTYEYYPLPDIQAENTLKQNLLDHIIIFENYPIAEEINKFAGDEVLGFVVKDVKSFEQTNYYFNITVIPGKTLDIHIRYNGVVYDRELVKGIRGHLENIIKQVIENPDVKVREIDILGEEEKEQIQYGFNSTYAEYRRDLTIVQLFEEQAGKIPDNIAVICKNESLTYRALNEKANRLAGLLREKGVAADSIVAIMTERSLEMVIGIMGILKAGGAYLPIDPEYPENRIRYMLEDSGTRLLLTQARLMYKLGFDFDIIDLEDRSIYVGDAHNLSNISHPNNLAYTIYTSGSTGRPKGVMVEHRPVVNFIKGMTDIIGFREEESILCLTSMSFDIFGLETLLPLAAGMKIAVADEEEQRDATALSKVIEKEEISIMQITPSRMQMLLGSEDGCRSLEKLRAILVGGEALSETLLKEMQTVTKAKLYNMYGPTETTIWSAVKDVTEEDKVTIGKPVINTKIYILDRGNCMQPVGIPGELCISGDGLARGYLKKPELTEEKFIKNPFIEGERLYKTGDLARWLPGGDIEYLGRIDQQVKIRGYRIEPGEIESRLKKYGPVKEAVVTAGEDNSNNKYLCAYIVGESVLTVAELRGYLAEELPDYMIPSYFVQLEEIPLNQSGKVDRQALPEPDGSVGTGKEYEAPGNELEEKLVLIWQDILQKEHIGIADSFFELGGHSLKATIMAARVHKETNVKIPLRVIFETPRIKALAQYIAKQEENKFRTIEKAVPLNRGEESEDHHSIYFASSAQKRMYAMQQMEKESTSYNMTVIFEMTGALEKEKLEGAFTRLIKRHESLRTSFYAKGKEIVQKVHNEIEFNIEYHDAENEEKAEKTARHFVRPFDLSKAPLLRAGLIAMPPVREGYPDRHMLLLDMHHIISDGTSMGILAKEFVEFYEGEKLPDLKLQYVDFAEWQNQLFATGKIEKQEAYWLDKLSSELPVLNMPTDFKRPAIQSFEGNKLDFSIDRELTGSLKAIALKNEATVFMVLFSAYNVMLYRYTGQEDIIVGSGTAGRFHADIENTIGMFVNMLALRSCPDGEKTFKEFLLEVKAAVLEAYENQDYPFEVLAEKLEPTRDLSRNPVFDVSFAVQNMEIPKVNIKGLEISQQKLENKTSKFDMTLFATEVQDRIEFSLEYSTRLFKQSTAERMIEHFINIVKAIVKEPEVKLKEIEWISEGERQQLDAFNNTYAAYDSEKTIVELIEAQADKTPDNVAIVYKDKHLTYSELDKEANRLVRYLMQDVQIQPDNLIGMLIPNCIEQVIAELGILKAGAGYVPIDPELPADRIKTIIDDAGLEVLISVKEYVRILNRLQWECSSFHTYICLDTEDVRHEEEAVTSSLMDKKLWEYVGSTATDEIEGGGWSSSYTGESLTQKEMDEYGDNALKKLLPYLNKAVKVLEIGCASGITMYRVAPYVKLYYGTDLSESIIEKNRERNAAEGIGNIRLKALAAYEIGGLDERDFDIIIINSVIQSFNGHNYLRKVIETAIGLMSYKGILFIGDIMDQDKKQELAQSLLEFKQKNKDKNYRTKTDLTAELFVARGYFEDLAAESEEIKEVKFSNKIHTIENELTRFRYDAILEINKNARELVTVGNKNRQQADLSVLKTFGTDRVKSSAAPNNIAYVIYTSGTTGKPKGVVIEHRSVVNMCFWHNRYYGVTDKDRATRYVRVSFDPSVNELFPYLIKGATVYMIPEEMRMDVVGLNRYFESNRISISLMPAQMCEQFMEIENHSLRLLITGGEPLRHYIKRSYELANNYGPTENTVVATSFVVENQYHNIPIGKPIDNCQIYILDKYNNLQPAGVPGELCIAGEGLARGYLNSPYLTAEKFTDNPFIPGGRIYKTGDLARWLQDGNLEFLGRIDHQVKLRGFRIELGEIESWLLKHEDIKEAVVIAKEDNSNNQYLCAYIAGEKALDEGELKAYLEKELPDYMIPACFVQLEKMPVNRSGKLDRRALPEPEGNTRTGAEYEAPGDETEEKLVSIWQEILKVQPIGINDNFFELGGHSLKATAMAAKIHREINTEVPLKEIFETPTIKELAEYIRKQEENGYEKIKKAEATEYYTEAYYPKNCYPVSSAQKRQHTLQQLEAENTGYNMPSAFELEGQLLKDRLERAFKELIRRHESLRTCFYMETGLGEEETILQKIEEEVGFNIEYHEAGNSEKVSEIADSFIRPFDLSRAPLFRAALISVSNEKERYVLLMDMHHIISDGTSMGILVKEFCMLYNGETLPELRLQYKDYAVWQCKRMKTEAMKKQEAYWLSEFANREGESAEIPVLNLPTDCPRPGMQHFEGDRIDIEVCKKLTEKLNTLAKETGTTLYMVLLAGFNILLSKYSGQEDIVVGSPIAGRPHADLEGIMGMFVNTLAIRNQPVGSKTFKSFLMEVKEKALKAYENQEFPFEELVDRVCKRRDMSRNPLFDVMLTLQNIELNAIQMEGVVLRPYDMENITAKLDMTVSVQEINEKLMIDIEYCTKLFRKDTVKRLGRHFVNILEKVTEKSGIRLEEIEITGDEEKKQLINTFNATETEYPYEKTIHRLFEEQAYVTPEKTALVYGDKTLTYKELNEKANQLARVLRGRGVCNDSIVGIMAERSLEMLVGIMGILKSGGAYLPIDPEYPEERIKYMLEDSGVEVLLTQARLQEKLRFGGEAICLEDENIYRGDSKNLENKYSSHDLAYVIYTSGSTGKPKGVMIEHRSVVNFIKGMTAIDFSDRNSILCLTSVSFDIMGLETLLPLSEGMKIVIADEEAQRDANKLSEIMEKEKIDTLQITPSRMKLLLENEDCRGSIGRLGIIMIGGEALPGSLLKEVQSIAKARIYNMYGPTETTIWSTMKEVTKEDKITIGKPIANTKVYILGENKQLQPINVPGELCIAGDGLARGYLNNPLLTKEKFAANPFVTGERMYKTGDLARWLPDGNIEFLGRIDNQVKIRGYRIELGEIESQLLTYHAVKEAVVAVREDNSSNKYICGYIVVKNELAAELNIAEIRTHLAKSLPDYMIPSYFIQLDKIPVNQNGKIDIKALPEPDGSIGTGTVYEAPRDETEEKLTDIWKTILNVQRIGINDNFFELGGHSLKATSLAGKIHKAFDVEIHLREVFKMPTIKALAEYIRLSEKNKFMMIQPAEEKAYYALSPVQKMVYTLQMMDADNTAYIIPGVTEIDGFIDNAKIEQVFKALIKRHEALRTSFELLEDGPIQKVHEEVEFMVQYEEAKEEAEVQYILQNFTKPFDLRIAPLFRVMLIGIQTADMSNKKHLLVYGIHHIISDGTTMAILAEEFESLYGGMELHKPVLQYKDYSEWQIKKLEAGILKESEAYWLNKFSGANSGGKLPVLNLPTDYPRPDIYTYEGDTYVFKLEAGLVSQIKAFAWRNGATLFTVLLEVLSIVLSKYSRQEDIIIGTVNAGRQNEETQDMVGLFINNVAMRCLPQKEKTAADYLMELQEDVISAFENQDYPIEDLVRKLNIKRDASRNALFDVMLILQNFGRDNTVSEQIAVASGEMTAEKYNYINRVSSYDMTLFVEEAGQEIFVNLQYCTSLFKRETIESFGRHFCEIAKEIAAKPEQRITDIGLIDEKETERILYDFSSFDTCRELDERSNQLAAYLAAEKGIKCDTPVGILISDVLYQAEALLGIVKAGGRPVAIDTELPEEKIKCIMEESGIQVVIARQEDTGRLNRLQWECSSFHTYICLDTDNVYAEGISDIVNMNKDIWEYVGQKAADDIEGGGWNSSYTGESFTKEEMDEYGDNVLKKLMPYLTKDKRVLEIGCASGISMYRIAPSVKLYYGTDLSSSIIERDRRRNAENSITNIGLKALAAHEIDSLEEKDFDIVIINSVIQMFPGHNYLRMVIEKVLSLMTDRGLLFIGDIMDQDMKQDLLQSLIEFKQNNRDKHYKTVTDLSDDLFIPKGYFEDLAKDIKGIRSLSFSNKIHTIENELTKFRYDTIIEIDKCTESEKGQSKNKYQIDRSALDRYAGESSGAETTYKLYIVDAGARLQPVGIPGELCIAEAGLSESYKKGKKPAEEKLYKTGNLARWLSDGSIEIVGKPDAETVIRPEAYEISEEEMKKVLYEFNNTQADYPKDKTFQELFEEQAQKTPDNVAVIYEDGSLTYKELNRRSNKLAETLRRSGVQTNEIVGIMIERSLEMVVGIMGIIKSGGAYAAIDPDYPRDRIEYMLCDSGIKILLTEEKLADRISFTGKTLDIISESCYYGSGENLENVNKPGDLVYIIYTSGTTGKPKGVMIEHRSLINITYAWKRDYRLEEAGVRLLQLASFSFDVFAGDLSRALTNGGTMVICPGDRRADLEALYRMIKSYRINILESTPALLIPLMTYIHENMLEIESLKLLIIGSDSLPVEEYRKLKQWYSQKMRILNSYGLTEVTIDSSFYEKEAEEIQGVGNVPIGRPMQNTQFYILDDKKRPQPVGTLGELYIGGDGLARGYLNRETLTAEKFVPNLFRPGEKMYRTGDIARWLPDGNVEFLGRADSQVKIRGYRIDLGEIESRLLKYPGIKEAVGEAKEDARGSKYLVAYIVIDKKPEREQDEVPDCRDMPKPDAAALREYLKKDLPDYMIPSYFMQLPKLPLTPNGKIDRKALPEPGGDIVTGAVYEAPRNKQEKMLVQIWKDTLKVDSIGINDDFFELGGHSLRAAFMTARVHKEMNVEIPLRVIFALPTIKQISEYMKGKELHRYGSIQKAEDKEYYEMSSAQKRMYTMQQFDLNSTSYNMPAIFEVEGELDLERLNRAFKELINRHESLRTSFELMEGQLVQKINKEVEFEIECFDNMLLSDNELSAEEIEEISKRFIRAFELSKAPLLRVGLVKLSQKYILMYDIHHIISDGVSTGILVDEFSKAYEGVELPPLRIQYKDFSEWQNELFRGDAIKEQEEYWVNKFSGEVPVLNLPADYPRAMLQSPEGIRKSFVLGKELTEKLREMAKETGSTMYMVLLAAYNVLLSKYSGQEDITVGCGMAGRPHADLEGIIGMFVNTLPMRNFPRGNMTFRAFLDEVKENTLGAYENQDYQFEKLVEKLKLKKDTGRNPLFDVFLELQNMEMHTDEMSGVRLRPYEIRHMDAQYDMAFDITEGSDCIYVAIEYPTGLYKEESIISIGKHFELILESATKNLDAEIKDINVSYEQPETKKPLLDMFDGDFDM